MKALVYTGTKSVEIRETARPEPCPGQALLRIRHCGVCGTDIGIFGGTHPRAAAPLILGHEFVGEVVTPASPRLAAGQRVTAYPLFSCGTCHACRNGTPHVCAQLRLVGIDGPGAMAEYLAVSEDLLYPVPDDMEDRVAALVEPLAVAVRAVDQARTRVNDRAVVFGAGPIGMLTALVLREAGAAQVIVSDIDPSRVARAAGLGFIAVNSGQEDLVARALAETDGDGADLVFECSGVAPAALNMTRVLRPGGTICMAAMHKKPNPVALLDINFKELTVIGTRVYTREQFQRSIGLARRLTPALKRLITHDLPLSAAQDVFALLADPGADSLKVMIDCQA